MRAYLEAALAFITCVLAYGSGYINGVEENYFDRELAQIKIDQCFQAIGKK